jgi:SAM-dependent methyltransferase
MDKTALYRDKNDDYFSNVRSDLLPLVPVGARTILEAGCGSGAFGAALKQRSRAYVVGVELSAEHAERARSALDEVIVGDIEKLMPGLDDRRFDLIVFNDVLEHLLDPWATLATAKTKLAERGAVFAAIPNVRHWSVVRALLFSGEWKYADWGILDRSHLRFFTGVSAARMFRQSGYSQLAVHRPLQRHSRSALLNRLTFGLFDDFLASHIVIVARA